MQIEISDEDFESLMERLMNSYVKNRLQVSTERDPKMNDKFLEEAQECLRLRDVLFEQQAINESKG